jgi:PKD repeat protein
VGNGGGGSTGGGGAAGGSGGTTGGTGQSTTTTTTSVFHLLARFSFRPKKPKRRAKVTFNAGTSSVSSGRIVSYSWRFGDKKKGKGRKVKHAYKKPGRYTVTLTVRDAAGHKATVRHKVKITR